MISTVNMTESSTMESCINQSQRRYSLVHVNRSQNIVNRATLIANGYHVFNFRLYGIVGSATFLMNTNGQWRVVLSELGREMTSKVTVLFQSWHATIVWAVIGEQPASPQWLQVGLPDITTPDKGPTETQQSEKKSWVANLERAPEWRYMFPNWTSSGQCIGCSNSTSPSNFFNVVRECSRFIEFKSTPSYTRSRDSTAWHQELQLSQYDLNCEKGYRLRVLDFGTLSTKNYLRDYDNTNKKQYLVMMYPLTDRQSLRHTYINYLILDEQKESEYNDATKLSLCYA